MADNDIRWVFSKKSKLWVPKHKSLRRLRNKLSWNVIQLIVQVLGAIAIPLAVVLVSAQLNHDRDISIDLQRQTTLETYIDSMSNLLLQNNLLGSQSNDVVRDVADARTLTALENLDPDRKGILVRFLYNSGLIGYSPSDRSSFPIVDLAFADLSNVNLHHALLIGAYIADANLNGADLRDMFSNYLNLHGDSLENANLSSALFANADLESVQLTNANLQFTRFDYANLSFAILSGADLSNANFLNANLSQADLYNTNITKEQLAEAKSLRGAIMPDGSTHP